MDAAVRMLMNAGARRVILLAALTVVMVTLGQLAPAVLHAQDPVGAWSAPINLSTNTEFSWFPDIAADASGRIHVVWETSFKSPTSNRGGGARRIISLVYRKWDGAWWEPNDIVSPLGLPSGHIYRVALAAGNNGYLYSTFNIVGTAYIRAPEQDAWSAARWTSPTLVADRGAAVYMSDVAVDSSGGVHVVWDQELLVKPEDGSEAYYTSDLFFAYSPDGGQIWQSPKNLSNVLKGVTREQIEIDPRGTIWVTWDEGWDRLSERGKQESGKVVYSKDNGQTWSPALVFDKPAKSNTQLTTVSNGQGGVLAVWRAIDQDPIFFAWSSDDGQTWSSPAETPGLLARAWDWTRFDAYDLALDSTGNMHLVAVGRTTITGDVESDGLFHIVWNGQQWGEPLRIYDGPDHAEYPRITVSRGNQLHVVWFTRDQYFTEGGKFNIWYSQKVTTAPELPLPSMPSPTALPQITQASVALPSPTAVRFGDVAPFDTRTLRTENDDVMIWIISLGPALLVVGLTVLVVRLRRNQNR